MGCMKTTTTTTKLGTFPRGMIYSLIIVSIHMYL